MENETGISLEDLHFGMAEAAASFRKFSVNYALIGGLAASYRSKSRFTKDIDFLLQIPALVLPPLLEDLQSREFRFDLIPTIREWTQHNAVVLTFRGVYVDWLKPAIPAFSHVLDRATDENVQGHQVRVASVEGLIVMKLMAFRLQDQIDIVSLLAFLHRPLDIDWIKTEWQTFAQLDDPRMHWLSEKLAAATQSD